MPYLSTFPTTPPSLPPAYSGVPGKSGVGKFVLGRSVPAGVSGQAVCPYIPEHILDSGYAFNATPQVIADDKRSTPPSVTPTYDSNVSVKLAADQEIPFIVPPVATTPKSTISAGVFPKEAVPPVDQACVRPAQSVSRSASVAGSAITNPVEPAKTKEVEPVHAPQAADAAPVRKTECR